MPKASTPAAPQAAQRAGHPPLAGPNILALRQGLELFERLGPERYAAPPGDLAASGVGGHFRHVHDYYVCLLAGLAEGRVDYDRRPRDPRFEQELAYAAHATRECIGALERLCAEDAERELLVRADASPDEDENGSWCRSTLARELRFLFSHTIHHYALIRLLLRAAGEECEESFGVAPSTLEYWKRNEPCAPSPGCGA